MSLKSGIWKTKGVFQMKKFPVKNGCKNKITWNYIPDGPLLFLNRDHPIETSLIRRYEWWIIVITKWKVSRNHQNEKKYNLYLLRSISVYFKAKIRPKRLKMRFQNIRYWCKLICLLFSKHLIPNRKENTPNAPQIIVNSHPFGAILHFERE